MEIKRNKYLQQLIDYQWDRQVKVISGIRRCGKSYLLSHIYKDYLLNNGVKEDQIIFIELDKLKDIRFRDPFVLADYVRETTSKQDKPFYLFVDEIQMSEKVDNPYNPEGKKISFYDVLNELKDIENLDIYVTGSNSKMLSKDILTEFRGRSDDIRMHPLSFSEYYDAVGGDIQAAFNEYSFYGGMPLILSRKNDTDKINYLKDLFTETYFKDIVERKKIEREDVLSDLTDLLSSVIGSLTNPTNVTNAINSKKKLSGEQLVSLNTVKSYMDHLEDAYLFHECKRYDVKGKSYFDYPNKYYCEDIGLRNARTGFRQQETTHIMENMIYNELVYRDYSVDIGVVYENKRNEHGNPVKIAREIDFVAVKGEKKIYLQSAYAIENDEKIRTENKPFSLTGDSFPKIIVRGDIGKRWYDENGILNIDIKEFLTQKDIV